MNKTIKLWAFALALWMFATVFVSTSNETHATIASVTLTWWTDVDCTLSDYAWTWLTASELAQSLNEKTNNIVCKWWTNPTKTVKIQLLDLTANNVGSIPAINFTGNLNATVNTNWSLQNSNATLTSAANMATQQTLFTKPVNKIWTYTGSIAIKWTVPAGTPAGDYQGNINITQS